MMQTHSEILTGGLPADKPQSDPILRTDAAASDGRPAAPADSADDAAETAAAKAVAPADDVPSSAVLSSAESGLSLPVNDKAQRPEERVTVRQNGDGDAPTVPEAAGEGGGEAAADRPDVDYADVAEKDLEVLRRTFPECAEMDSLCHLENPLRYARLRDLGLSPEEAYLATARTRKQPDNRSHLTSSVPRAAAGGIGMTTAQLSAARELFEGLSDAELTRLYRRVMS